MEVNLKQNASQIKQFFVQMPKKTRIIWGVGAALLVILAVVITMQLNARTPEYRALYPNMDAAESTEIYQTITLMGGDAQVGTTGEVMVPYDEHDMWLMRMAAEGYPRSGPSYDIYGTYAGMTATETDREQGTLFYLQDRIQVTLETMAEVEDAVVTIAQPEESDYVWQEAANEGRATATVLVTTIPGVVLSPEQVTTVKNMVSTAVLNLAPGDVTVVDAKTSLELRGTAGSNEEQDIAYDQNVELDQIVQRQMEDNIVRLLTPRYGEDGVVATAKVTLNYDKMMTETLELMERPVDEDGEGGGGYISASSGAFGLNGAQTVGGIVGEENNTDIPIYPYATTDDVEDATSFAWDNDFIYGSVQTQVERGNYILERATVSVLVDEENLTPARVDELTALISTSVDIPVELITVSAFQPEPIVDEDPTEEDPTEPALTLWESQPLWVWIVLGVALLLFIVGIVLLILWRKRAKKRKLEAALLAKQLEEEEAARKAQEEIDAHKKLLEEQALEGTDPKHEAILEEIRDFANKNPEITANLLRAWMREDD